ncbi:MAG: hypothetical protein ACJAT3_002544, partial [Akkermansiaceae bacterium]
MGFIKIFLDNETQSQYKRPDMIIKQALIGSMTVLACSTVHGESLEELAARLEQLEKKVAPVTADDIDAA